MQFSAFQSAINRVFDSKADKAQAARKEADGFNPLSIASSIQRAGHFRPLLSVGYMPIWANPGLASQNHRSLPSFIKEVFILFSNISTVKSFRLTSPHFSLSWG